MLVVELFTKESRKKINIEQLAENVDFGDIITARELIGMALDDPQNEKHKYFEFLKHLRDTVNAEYSTKVHKHAAKLAHAKA